MPVSRSRVLNWGSAMRALLRVCREPRQENPGWLGIDGCKSSTQSPPLQRFEKGRIRKGTRPQKEPSSQARSFPAGTRTWGLELGTLFFFFVLLCFVLL